MSSHIYWQIEAPQNVFGPVRVAESTPSRGEARLLASKNKWWRPPLMIAKNASIDECTVPHFVYGLIIVLALSSLILASPLQARIQLDIVAKFRNVGIELDIVTLIDWEVEAAKSKVALLAIATPPRSSFSFRGEDWSLLIDLWSKAVKAQSEILECHRDDEGEGNIGCLYSHHKCRPRDQDRHRFPSERSGFLCPFEG